MNKSAIQKFAIWARTELIAQVSQKAYQYGITEEGYTWKFKIHIFQSEPAFAE